jgi:hypothetical protein
MPAEGWQSVFGVYTGTGDVPALLGSYSVENGVLIFRPRFPLASGVQLRAVFHAPEAAPVESTFEIPRLETGPATQVEHVYPSADTLPANQLKFYLVFSAAMSKGEAWQRIHLLDQNGAAIDLPFLELGEELWDPRFTRLTVLFDPGRIKRGVMPREQVGAALEVGRQYTLVIDREWHDAHGERLRDEFHKTFRVGPDERTGIDPRRWSVHAPKAGSLEPLVVNLGRPMDYALLLRVIGVAGPKGALTGMIDTARDETEWRFVPDQPWKGGAYRLEIDSSLEDLAGNRIGRPFDVDTFDPISKHLSSQSISLPFKITEN